MEIPHEIVCHLSFDVIGISGHDLSVDVQTNHILNIA